MAKQGIHTSRAQESVTLSRESFGTLSDKEKKLFVERAAGDLELAIDWVEEHESSDDAGVEIITETLDEFGAFLSQSKNGRLLLKQLLSAKAKAAAAARTATERSEASRKGAEKIPREKRVARAIKASKAAKELSTAEERSERARKAAEARWDHLRKKKR